jgi:hypothetical protein
MSTKKHSPAIGDVSPVLDKYLGLDQQATRNFDGGPRVRRVPSNAYTRRGALVREYESGATVIHPAAFDRVFGTIYPPRGDPARPSRSTSRHPRELRLRLEKNPATAVGHTAKQSGCNQEILALLVTTGCLDP